MHALAAMSRIARARDKETILIFGMQMICWVGRSKDERSQWEATLECLVGVRVADSKAGAQPCIVPVNARPREQRLPSPVFRDDLNTEDKTSDLLESNQVHAQNHCNGPEASALGAF